MRLLFAVVATVALMTPAEAGHIAGHYGGVPAVQPAPLPWRHQQPQYQRPPLAPPPQPHYVIPPPIVVYPAPPPYERPARRAAPNVCQSGNCD